MNAPKMGRTAGGEMQKHRSSQIVFAKNLLFGHPVPPTVRGTGSHLNFIHLFILNAHSGTIESFSNAIHILQDMKAQPILSILAVAYVKQFSKAFAKILINGAIKDILHKEGERQRQRKRATGEKIKVAQRCCRTPASMGKKSCA